MAVLSGSVVVGGVPYNNATVNAYLASRCPGYAGQGVAFSPPMAQGAAPPAGAPDATATTGTNEGNVGAFQITVPNGVDIYLQAVVVGLPFGWELRPGAVSGTVTSVTAGDATIVIGGTATAPTVQVGTVPYSQISGGPAGVTWPLTNSADMGFQPNSVANNALDLHNNASAVNGVTVTGTATGQHPSIAATGSDANVGLDLRAKGAGNITFGQGGNLSAFFNGSTSTIALTVAGSGTQLVLTQDEGIISSGPAGQGIGISSTSTAGIYLASLGGSGKIQFTDNGGGVLFNTGVLANGLSIEGAATGSSPSIAAVGTDANIALNLVTKGTGALQINGAAGTATQVLTSNGAGAAPTWQTPSGGTVTSVTAADATIVIGGTATAPTVRVGTLTGAVLTWPLTNSADEGFRPNSVANNALNLHNNASAVNGVQVTGTATTVAPIIAAIGSDTNIDLSLSGKGTGSVRLPTGQKTTVIASGALPTVAVTSGTAFQCLTTRDVTLVIAVTATLLSGTATIAFSPDNVTYSTLGVATPGVAGGVDLDTIAVPAGWWVKVTLSNATVTATYY